MPHMKSSPTFLALILALTSVTGAQSPRAPLIIQNVTIIDVTGAPAQLHRTVIVERGRIQEIYETKRA